MRKIKALSYSQISKYERCPRLWYEQYVLGNWYQEHSEPLSFGIAFHMGMEQMMRDWGKVVCLDNAQSQFEFEYNFGREKGTDPKQWVPKGNIMLENMFLMLGRKNFKPVKIEKPCTRKNFKGRADCLAKVDKEIVLIDWKTSTREFSPYRVQEDEQLTAYGWMLPGDWTMMAFGVANKRTYKTYWYETWRSPEQIQEFADKVKRIRTELETLEKFMGRHTDEACMAWNRKCDIWQAGICRGRDDF